MTATILITCDCGTCAQLQLVPAANHAEARLTLRSDTRGAQQWTGDGERDYAPGHAVSEDQPKPPSRCPFCQTTHKFGPSDYCKAQASEVLADSEQVRHG